MNHIDEIIIRKCGKRGHWKGDQECEVKSTYQIDAEDDDDIDPKSWEIIMKEQAEDEEYDERYDDNEEEYAAPETADHQVSIWTS